MRACDSAAAAAAADCRILFRSTGAAWRGRQLVCWMWGRRLRGLAFSCLNAGALELSRLLGRRRMRCRRPQWLLPAQATTRARPESEQHHVKSAALRRSTDLQNTNTGSSTGRSPHTSLRTCHARCIHAQQQQTAAPACRPPYMHVLSCHTLRIYHA